VLSGELAAGIIKGLQSNGVAACPKVSSTSNTERKRRPRIEIFRPCSTISATSRNLKSTETAPKSLNGRYESSTSGRFKLQSERVTLGL
jgi:hypothetical protein